MDIEFDFLHTDDDDLEISGGDLVIGESAMQEVGMLVRLNSGALKHDPILGPNLIQLVKERADDDEFETRMRIHLSRDNKSYDEMKSLINIKKE